MTLDQQKTEDHKREVDDPDPVQPHGKPFGSGYKGKPGRGMKVLQGIKFFPIRF